MMLQCLVDSQLCRLSVLKFSAVSLLFHCDDANVLCTKRKYVIDVIRFM
jgi:hypothetical protein